MNIMQYRSYLRLFVAGLISILSHGCVYIHVTKLTDDDLEWINTYNYGDSVFFTSTHGNLDTLVVRSLSITPRTDFTSAKVLDRIRRLMPDIILY